MDIVIRSGGGNPTAVRAKRQVFDTANETAQDETLFPRNRVPDLEFTYLRVACIRSRSKEPAIRAVGHATDRLLVSQQNANWFSCPWIPGSHRAVLDGYSQFPAIGTEGHAADRGTGLQDERRLRFGAVPNPDRLVLGGRDEPAAVSAERHAPDTFGVTTQNEGGFFR